MVQPILLERQGRPNTECPTQKQGQVAGPEEAKCEATGASCIDLTSLPAYWPPETSPMNFDMILVLSVGKRMYWEPEVLCGLKMSLSS